MPLARPQRALVLAILLPAVAGAVEIRSYRAERHDRFLESPRGLAPNPEFLHGAASFSGIGWLLADPRRQLALVTPKHAVFATHFLPEPGGTLRFLSPAGLAIDRTTVANHPIPGADGKASDLSLVELDEPLDPATGIQPFPYLDLPAEADYTGERIAVFGLHRRGGSATIKSIANMRIRGLHRTRAMRFDYSELTGGDDDCYLETGDSGSPSFGFRRGLPALVGTHSGISREPLGRMNYDTFLPHYAAGIDAKVAADGFRITPVNAPRTTTECRFLLHPRNAGAAVVVELRLENTGSATTGNVELGFDLGAIPPPDRIDAEGWIEDDGKPLRRARLAAGDRATVTLRWNVPPGIGTRKFPVRWRSDKAPAGELEARFTPTPTFAAWASDLGEPGRDDDPDGDGLPNLLEYAFGGDPTDGDPVLADGSRQVPRPEFTDGEPCLCFPERSDAGARGLRYRVEFSEDLDTWDTGPPAGLESDTAPLDPPRPDFVERRVSWPRDGARRFARVRVELEE